MRFLTRWDFWSETLQKSHLVKNLNLINLRFLTRWDFWRVRFLTRWDFWRDDHVDIFSTCLLYLGIWIVLVYNWLQGVNYDHIYFENILFIFMLTFVSQSPYLSIVIVINFFSTFEWWVCLLKDAQVCVYALDKQYKLKWRESKNS